VLSIKLKCNKYILRQTQLSYMIGVFDEVYILFHFNA
jgi:hypothetical protein